MLKYKLTPLLVAICVASGLTHQAYAANVSAADAKTEQLIKKINTRTMQLEAEVKQLRAQLVQLKQTNVKESQQLAKQATVEKQRKDRHHMLASLGTTPVVSSPYIGIRSQYDGSDLIVNIPSYNQDVQLLQQQQKMQNAFKGKGIKGSVVPLPLIELSGKVEGQVIGNRGMDGSRSSDIDLSGTELDVTGHFTPWLTGFIALNYDKALPGYGSTVTRTDNSRIYLNKAWVTLGNLNVTPFYATLGQRYLFGQYSNFMISSPLTELLSKIKARALLLGYQHPGANGAYATLYSFRGDSTTGNTNLNQFGGTLGYQFNTATITSDVGVDYVTNMADSQGMQNTGNPAAFPGFGATGLYERLMDRVPGVAAHARFGFGPLFLVGEYTGAIKSFNSANLTFNNVGAKPRAYSVQGAYQFKVFNKPANIALGYSQTSDALALNLPQRRYISTFNISIWKDTIASLEFSRDVNYALTDFATGQYLLNRRVLVPTGHFSNTVTAQFGVYF